jgi:probable HAF family extracellular repeat protein
MFHAGKYGSPRDSRRGSRTAPRARKSWDRRRGLAVEQLEDRSLLSAYTLTDLGTLGVSIASASDIKEAGQVVGAAVTAAGQSHAFLWRDGAMTDLGTLGGIYSGAGGLNDVG